MPGTGAPPFSATKYTEREEVVSCKPPQSEPGDMLPLPAPPGTSSVPLTVKFKVRHAERSSVHSVPKAVIDRKFPLSTNPCYKITTVFSHAQTVVLCVGCSTVLCQPTGGKARLTEGCSFRRKQH
nr:PREDICTED: 40S ribosomal protein S27-like [Opisthocomus hoazin]